MKTSTFKKLIYVGLKQNKEDGRNRFVFYSQGFWHLDFKLSDEIDYNTFYVIENGNARAVIV